ncbi:MAG: thermonuclease family protein [Zoogloeaceae bacterium]|jgi:endonuclease YncB( thermonuclease family)|nr:thermonuclease family protein [Zoogloeaceae bacterium]
MAVPRKSVFTAARIADVLKFFGLSVAARRTAALFLSLIITLVVALCGRNALEKEFSGRVTAVADGDTLTVVTLDTALHRVRLAGIDAPERSQAFGQEARRYLSRLCLGAQAKVVVTAQDRYGREVGVVTCREEEVNARLVAAGMAWVYRGYNDDPALLAVEDAARARKIGLWAERDPVPPWEYRKIQKPMQ